jgi:hypothetical protein
MSEIETVTQPQLFDRLNNLCDDVKREIYSFVDYETRLRVLFSRGNNGDIVSSRRLWNMFTAKNLNKIYKNCITDKIFEINNSSTSHPYGYTNKRLKQSIIEMFPIPDTVLWTDRYGDTQLTHQMNPCIIHVKSQLSHSSFTKSMKGDSIVRAYQTLTQVYCDNVSFVNYLRKTAYMLVASIIIYKETVERDRVVKAQEALRRLTVRRAVKERSAYENKMKLQAEREKIRKQRMEEIEQEKLARAVQRLQRKQEQMILKETDKQVKEKERQQRAALKRQRDVFKRNRTEQLQRMKIVTLYKAMVTRPLKKKFAQDEKQTLKENKKSLALAKKNLKKHQNLKTITVAIK